MMIKDRLASLPQQLLGYDDDGPDQINQDFMSAGRDEEEDDWFEAKPEDIYAGILSA